MTDAQTYSIKEMLTIMSDESKADRAEMNGKIDNLHIDFTEALKVRAEIDKEQDGRIGILENWKAFVMGAVWLLSGSGAITGLYFLFNWMTKNV